ncbi:MAG: chloramphenicol phosphotransferase CPT family protein [Chloroflexi bacterium]|nr:chloramphenicol phosphotransferase CPT family protein [Chloroflexota bacterium]MCL5275748.1 chloramphenicol phosphotransferase CPT family protein [Chloroflexota bacterium]
MPETCGIRCPLDVLERRERTRCNRTLGQARALRVRAGNAPHAFNQLLRESGRVHTGVTRAD